MVHPGVSTKHVVSMCRRFTPTGPLVHGKKWDTLISSQSKLKIDKNNKNQNQMKWLKIKNFSNFKQSNWHTAPLCYSNHRLSASVGHRILQSRTWYEQRISGAFMWSTGEKPTKCCMPLRPLHSIRLHPGIILFWYCTVCTVHISHKVDFIFYLFVAYVIDEHDNLFYRINMRFICTELWYVELVVLEKKQKPKTPTFLGRSRTSTFGH